MMVKGRADVVLAALKRVGATGSKTPETVVNAPVPRSEVRQEPPIPSLYDWHRDQAGVALETAVNCLNQAIQGLEGLRGALLRLGQMQYHDRMDEDEDGGEEGFEDFEESEPTSLIPEPIVVPTNSSSSVNPEEGLADFWKKERQRILKALSEDTEDDKLEEEDGVPFVGQVRALPPGREPEEVTIGTVGTIKPSFLKEK